MHAMIFDFMRRRAFTYGQRHRRARRMRSICAKAGVIHTGVISADYAARKTCRRHIERRRRR